MYSLGRQPASLRGWRSRCQTRSDGVGRWLTNAADIADGSGDRYLTDCTLIDVPLNARAYITGLQLEGHVLLGDKLCGV